jgi:hypothetical protein
MPSAQITISDRTYEAKVTATCASGFKSTPKQATFNNPAINIRAVEEKLGGSGNPSTGSLPNNAYKLCAGEHGTGHTSQTDMALRFCVFHGYTSVENVDSTSQSGTCAVYHESGNGRRIDGGHGTKISQIKCTTGVGSSQTFNDPTINLRQAEQDLGAQGSGSPDPSSLSTDPYLLCAGEHGSGHTSQDHMTVRFCELHGFTDVIRSSPTTTAALAPFSTRMATAVASTVATAPRSHRLCALGG